MYRCSFPSFLTLYKILYSLCVTFYQLLVAILLTIMFQSCEIPWSNVENKYRYYFLKLVFIEITIGLTISNFMMIYKFYYYMKTHNNIFNPNFPIFLLYENTWQYTKPTIWPNNYMNLDGTILVNTICVFQLYLVYHIPLDI